MDANEELPMQVRNHSKKYFRFTFNDAFIDNVVQRMAQN
jgi:hypothetical protein